ncbi:hypothetical protein FQN53_005751 [Emmonsiellopsis sp. PD_33]|nr:hypothetical protein FQN53_005751 [Emmonsiellopsis sp. PD_33]KAK2800410.1 hypothetical protein FQN51_006136 [Onygenales sp. PD_10]
MASAVRQVANLRQVHIKMVPSPRTIAESQLVLGAMQKFGEVSMFLNLKNFPSLRPTNSGRAALAIFESVNARNAAVEASPITIPLPKSSSVSSPRQSRENSRSSILCTIEPSHHNHATSVMQNPYYNSFDIAKSVDIHDLHQTRVHDGQEYRIPTSQHADCFPRRKRQIPYRIQQKILREGQEFGVSSLMGMWRDGELAKEERTRANAAKSKERRRQRGEEPKAAGKVEGNVGSRISKAEEKSGIHTEVD